VSRSAIRPLITEVSPRSPAAESYRMLRTNIDFSAIDRKIQTIMLTSAGPEEGKSTTAANLAVVYAQAGRKVLIIDADMRKPSLHLTFNLSNRRGLSNVMIGQVSLEDAVQPSDTDHLHCLTSGPIPPNPAEMLASSRMANLLEELRKAYDHIIIDTPPVIAVTDPQIIASRCDGVLLVVEYGRVRRELALKAKQLLEHAQANILGVVINNKKHSKEHEYYYQYYG